MHQPALAKRASPDSVIQTDQLPFAQVGFQGNLSLDKMSLLVLGMSQQLEVSRPSNDTLFSQGFAGSVAFLAAGGLRSHCQQSQEELD